MPGKDHGGCPHIDIRILGREVGHQVEVVRHERVVVEVVLRRPQAIESQIGGEIGEAKFLVPHLAVRPVFPAVARENHHHSNIHGNTPLLMVPL